MLDAASGKQVLRFAKDDKHGGVCEVYQFAQGNEVGGDCDRLGADAVVLGAG
jgi:hypothetical protein